MLIELADALQLQSRAVRLDLDSISGLQLPAILHWELNHYVILIEVSTKNGEITYLLADPAIGIRKAAEKEFSQGFTGVALEINPNKEFLPERAHTRLQVKQLWSGMHGIVAALLKVLALSLLIQAISLVMPFYLQTAVDTVVPAQDKDLAKVLFVGFLGLLAINTVSSWTRSQLMLILGNRLSLQTTTNLFRHTVFLPTLWFERRHLGDVISRFGSMQPINDLISRGLVSGIVDGILALLTLGLMILYSPILSGIAIFAVFLISLIKVFYFNAAKILSDNLLSAQANEESVFIESIRGIETIKGFCQESSRQKIWQGKKNASVEATINNGKLSANFEAASAAAVGLEALLFVYIGANLVINAEVTLGMMFAYQAYKQNFIGAAVRLVDQLMSYKLLGVHLDRISDIAFSRGDSLPDMEDFASAPFKNLELKNIQFQYSHESPKVLENLDLKIQFGKTTAIIGKSGCGKTTLVKILCGILEAQSGEFLIDGMPLENYGRRRYRNQLGIVSQNDTLFSGSLAENISFFDPDYDKDWLVSCCRQAAIHDEINSMPMGYDTMVGDMGSNLSGGQKQRILLARALYKKPTILIIDEGTAHLDISTEKLVAASIKALGITRIIVAHRPETIGSADHVVEIFHKASATLASTDGLIRQSRQTNAF